MISKGRDRTFKHSVTLIEPDGSVQPMCLDQLALRFPLLNLKVYLEKMEETMSNLETILAAQKDG